ncbi:MAG: alpha/beta hydrolase [Terriglobia bacterium]
MPIAHNRFTRIVVLVLLAAWPNANGWAQSRVECSALNSKFLKAPVRYCAFLPPHYDDSTPAKNPSSRIIRRYPVLYYLHGLGDNEQSLVNSGGWNLIQDLHEQHKIGDFIIVAPEGDRTFYVNSRNGRTPYSDFFIREFMPAMEHRYHVLKSSRGIMGISMGGYGALRFAFAYPGLFTSVSAQSAALMPESPKDLNVAMNSGLGQAALLGDVFGNPIDLAFWRQNSPFILARKNHALIAKLKIYFDCGTEDEYGFDRGASALHKQLVAEKIKHEFHLYPGGHNLVFFLQHLGESVEFHSRAFDEAR